ADEQRRRHDLATRLRRSVNSMGPFAHCSATGQQLMVSMVSFSFDTGGHDARIVLLLDEPGRYVAEEALKSSEERDRELFETANDVIFLHDLKGKIIAV